MFGDQLKRTLNLIPYLYGLYSESVCYIGECTRLKFVELRHVVFYYVNWIVLISFIGNHLVHEVHPSHDNGWLGDSHRHHDCRLCNGINKWNQHEKDICWCCEHYSHFVSKVWNKIKMDWWHNCRKCKCLMNESNSENQTVSTSVAK